MEKNNIFKIAWSWVKDWSEDLAYGFGASISVSFLWEQFVHIIAVIIGGVLLTISNHYLRIYLNKDERKDK